MAKNINGFFSRLTDCWISLIGIFCLLSLTSCLSVEGNFSTPKSEEFLRKKPRNVILVIFNHGYSSRQAGYFKARFPEILEETTLNNEDLILFSQVRNSIDLSSDTHSQFIESAVKYFHTKFKVPIENMILAGQSCGGWASLQAALKYPHIGGVIAFAPTCHGKVSEGWHIQPEVSMSRATEIDRLARHFNSPGVIFLYENDSYYNVNDWQKFELSAIPRSQNLKVEKIAWEKIQDLCWKCDERNDSHGAMVTSEFAREYYPTHIQPLIEFVRKKAKSSKMEKNPK